VQALDELKNEPYSADLQKEDREYVIKKFGLDEAEFEKIMNLPKKKFEDYPSYTNSRLYGCANLLFSLGKKIRNPKNGSG
jgi:hypothetical protein